MNRFDLEKVGSHKTSFLHHISFNHFLMIQPKESIFTASERGNIARIKEIIENCEKYISIKDIDLMPKYSQHCE